VDHPTLSPVFPSPPPAAQRPSVLIVGSCQGKVFVADDLLVYAETLDGEEAIRAWLIQHGIRMASRQKGSTSQSARNAVGRSPSGPAKARDDGGKDKCRINLVIQSARPCLDGAVRRGWLKETRHA
jgi:hypothetical protein